MFDPTRHQNIKTQENSRRKVYGRRIGRPLRQGRTRALEKILPHYFMTPDDLNILPGHQSLWLEIGFGGGEHLLWQAERNPQTLCIGCEPFLNGVTLLLKSLEKKPVDNIKIWPDDARDILEKMAPECLERVFILHPDPWPKSRHHKRRFIQKETLDLLARLLKKGGLLRMASDHPSMASWMLEKTYHHPAFEWQAKSCSDWRTPLADWPQTRYEKKGLDQRRKPYYLSFIKK